MGWVVPMIARCDTCRHGHLVDVPLRCIQMGSPTIPDGWRSDGMVFECPKCYASRVRSKHEDSPPTCVRCGTVLKINGSCASCMGYTRRDGE
jgi:ribosomal protein S27E